VPLRAPACQRRKTEGNLMKRAAIAAAALLLASGALSLAGGVVTVAAAPASAGDAPTVPTLSGIIEKEIRWGMSHADVTDTYNKVGGLFDREYAPQLRLLQPGVQQQQLEADRDTRKANFERSLTKFVGDAPTGYDVTALHGEYTYKNDESVQRLFKDGKTRYFFYIRDRLWKVYDEIPLKEGAKLGASYQDAITKLNGALSVAGRIRAANQSQGLERTEVDWQDRTDHLRAIDRSSEHLVGLVVEDKSTLQNLSALRSNKPTDPFAIDPSIAAVTRGGISDPNAARSAGGGDAGARGKR
jgi:hypothetical protein